MPYLTIKTNAKLDSDKRKTLSQLLALCLSEPTQRVYIEFSDPERHL